MTLEEAKKNIGRIVIYTPFEKCNEDQKELGLIKMVNDKYVFVVYDLSGRGIPTNPEYIELEVK